MKIKFKKLHPKAKIPTKGTSGAAAYDLYAAHGAILHVSQTILIGTGIALEIPSGYEGQIRPRSGMAARYCITVLNSPGTVDCDYRGEVKVLLYKASELCTSSISVIAPGDKIAQLVIAPVLDVEFEETNELDDTERGENGFGSTGR